MSMNAVKKHPLQDDDLLENGLKMIGENTHTHTYTNTDRDTQSNIKTVNKENWVKFDDDANGNEGSGSINNNETNTTIYNNNNNNIKNYNNNYNNNINNKKSSIGLNETANSIENRLSPSITTLPIVKHHHHKQQQLQLQQEGREEEGEEEEELSNVSNTLRNKKQQSSEDVDVDYKMTHETKYKPDQTSSILTGTAGSDATPAVLTTQSTHVNLNSTMARSQQNALQQEQSVLSSYNSQSLQHHQLSHRVQNKNGTAIKNSTNSMKMAQGNTTGIGIGTDRDGSEGGGTESNSSMQGNYSTISAETQPSMRTIELSIGRIREGFANGEVIVSLLPTNTRWPWITPAIFRPELVPEELMAQGLTLTVEEYVNAMEILVNDYRFTIYNTCYKRILICWVLFAFIVLLSVLFSGLQGVALFSLGVAWLFLNATVIFFCMWIKLRLSRGLEKCLARVNRLLMKHNILLVLDDRGHISCHKVNLCFLYFDSMPCINFLNEFLEQTEQNGGETIKAGWESKLDIDINDIIIQGSNPVRLSRKQAIAQEMYLSYLQRWGKDFLRRRLDWTVQEAGVHDTPRHLQSSICPCQYEEEILRNKIKIQLQRTYCCRTNCLACWI